MRKTWKKAAGVLLLTGALFAQSLTAFAATGTVTSESANIRSTASASGAKVAGVSKDATLDVVSKTTGDDGSTWYLINVDANTKGYVRSDLVSVDGDVPTSSAPAAETAAEAAPAETTVTVEAMAATSATVTENSINVRKSASASAAQVGTATKGTAMTVTGSADGADGKKWYEVSFINNGSTVTGFVRSDLVALGEASEPAEGEGSDAEIAVEGEEQEMGADEAAMEELANAESSEEAAPEVSNADYELVYTSGSDGEDAWYLYDHIGNKRMKLEDLLSAEEINASNMEIMESRASKMKMAIIILAVLLVIALGAVTILGIRKSGKKYASYDEYYDYEDEEYDEYEEEEEEEIPAPKKAAKPAKKEKKAFSKRGKRVDYEEEEYEYEDEYEEEYEEEDVIIAPAPKRKSPSRGGDASWKSKKYTTDEDDDLDFSFIDVD